MADLNTMGTRGQQGTSPHLSPSPWHGGLTGDILEVNASTSAALPDVPEASGSADEVPAKAPQNFDFEASPPAGTVVMYHGQRYVRVEGSTLHETLAGETLELFHWSSHCARCAGEFLAKMTLSRGATRRCEICRTVERGKV